MSTAKIDLLREQIRGAHEFLDTVLEDISPEQAHWQPNGRAQSIAAHYAHLLITEDKVINGLVQGGTPLAQSSYENKTGLSELPPPPADGEVTYGPDWWQQIKVNFDEAKAYAQAIYEATDAYLATLTDEDLERPIQTPFSEIPLARILNGPILAHTQHHTGEISCLKGLQDLKGYPF